MAMMQGWRHWWQLHVFGGDEIWQELVDRALALLHDQALNELGQLGVRGSMRSIPA